jgi:2-polyprenyl-3-methyl-5-hydroxy-6-metoxy-1,4-benzoquinol methylase
MKINPCFICGEKDDYSTVCEIDSGNRKIMACGCGHQFIYPPPTEEELGTIYREDYYESWGVDDDFNKLFKLKLKTSEGLIKKTLKYLSPKGKRHLDIGCAFGYMIEAALSAGYESEGLEISPAADEAVKLGYNVKKTMLKDAGYPDDHFDLITAVDVIEHIPEPIEWLYECHRILKKGGILLMVTPDCSSLPARIKKAMWPHYKVEHLHYYTPETMKRLFISHGFSHILNEAGVKYLSLNYIASHYNKFHDKGPEAKALKLLTALSPKKISDYPVPFPSEMLVIGRKE